MCSSICLQKYNTYRFNEIIQDNLDYQSKKPFPHLVRDNVFPMSILKATIDEIIDNPTVNDKGCVLGWYLIYRL